MGKGFKANLSFAWIIPHLSLIFAASHTTQLPNSCNNARRLHQSERFLCSRNRQLSTSITQWRLSSNTSCELVWRHSGRPRQTMHRQAFGPSASHLWADQIVLTALYVPSMIPQQILPSILPYTTTCIAFEVANVDYYLKFYQNIFCPHIANVVRYNHIVEILNVGHWEKNLLSLPTCFVWTNLLLSGLMKERTNAKLVEIVLILCSVTPQDLKVKRYWVQWAKMHMYLQIPKPRCQVRYLVTINRSDA